MKKLADSEVEAGYALIAAKHEKHLKQHGIKLPKLRNKAGQWTRDALVLVKLAEGYPATKPISKTDLTAFIIFVTRAPPANPHAVLPLLSRNQ